MKFKIFCIIFIAIFLGGSVFLNGQADTLKAEASAKEAEVTAYKKEADNKTREAKEFMAEIESLKTKKTELLFLALFIRMLKTGGRCACIVPDGVLFGSSKAHKAIRKTIIEDNRLEAVISMPSGVFKPYAGVSTGILIFTKTGHGGTDNVWFYDMKADGFSLDDKRTPVTENDIPDIIERFKNLDKEVERKRTDQSFMVPKKDIVENDYDLSINKYKEIEYTPVEYPPTSEIMANIRELELEIGKEMDELERLLGL